VAELKSQGMNFQQIKDKLVSQSWASIKDDKTVEDALAELLDRMNRKKAMDKLTRQRVWSPEEAAPDTTVKKAVDELIMSEGMSLEEAVVRLTSQRWTIDEAVDRVSKRLGIPKKSLRNHCQGRRPSSRPKKPQKPPIQGL